MTRTLMDKIVKAGTYDTRKYRYTERIMADATHQYRVIKRIAINALGTTAALSDASDANPDGWQTVV